MATVIAKWDNGVQRVFKNKDKLNVIITKAELDMWCEEHHFLKPTYEVIEDEDEERESNEQQRRTHQPG